MCSINVAVDGLPLSWCVVSEYRDKPPAPASTAPIMNALTPPRSLCVFACRSRPFANSSGQLIETSRSIRQRGFRRGNLEYHYSKYGRQIVLGAFSLCRDDIDDGKGNVMSCGG